MSLGMHITDGKRCSVLHEISTPHLDWVKKFTRSCSLLTGKQDTTTCSQQLFRCLKPNGAALSWAEQEAAAHTCSAHCEAACPWPSPVCVPVPSPKLAPVHSAAQALWGAAPWGEAAELPRSPQPGMCCSAVLVCGEPAPLAQVSGIVPQQGWCQAMLLVPDQTKCKAKPGRQHSTASASAELKYLSGSCAGPSQHVVPPGARRHHNKDS